MPADLPARPALGRPSPWGLLLVVAALALAGCAPRAAPAAGGPAARDLRAFQVDPRPLAGRYVAAVPEFDVRVGRVDIQGIERERLEPGFYRELGSGVKDIFITEAFNSQQFQLVERADLDKLLTEQNFGQSGRVDPETAAEVGRLVGAEVIINGNVTEFGVQSTGGGGRLFGIFGGSAETVTVRVSVDVRVVDVATGIILSVGTGTATESQTNVAFDLFNVVRNLGGGASGDTIVDLAVRNAIRGAINEVARRLPAKSAR